MQGERETIADADRLLHRHRLRIRTVDVSFAAAVGSARHDFAAGGAERDALVEVWRDWSLGQLDGYRADLVELSRARPELDTEVASILGTLAEAETRVRDG